jgi:Acetoacetate decarboxylase (ADC)
MARPAPARPARYTQRPAAVIESRSSSPFDFVGHMTATVAILPVAHDAARTMLPPGLDLAAQDVMRGDRHPLVLILGRQRGVRSRLLPFGADYLEFILAVPFVEHRAGRERFAGPYCYPARLYLDRGLPTLAGRLLYAYAKRRAAIRMTAGSYRVAELAGGAPMLEARYWTARPGDIPLPYRRSNAVRSAGDQPFSRRLAVFRRGSRA